MEQSKNLRTPILAVLQDIGTLLLLAIAFPINCIVVLAALLRNFLTRPFHKQVVANRNRKNIMVTGGKMTKALQLARSFHAAGHRVVLVETHKYWLTGHRFSNAVDRFYTVPAPQKDPEGYTQALVSIAKKENIDVYIPVCSPVASYYDSLAKPALSAYCEVFHFDAEVTKMLDDKFTFSQKALSLGLSVPKTFLITDPEQVLNFDFTNEKRKYILKSIAYDSVHRLDMTKLPMDSREKMAVHVRSLPISQDNPWLMQEFIPGKEYCTHSTVRNGFLRVYCCCESSAFQVNYENVDNPRIFQWVNHFVQQLKLTGQISFDFIEAEDGTVYAIECNPRTHSAITMFYNHPKLADAYMSDAPDPNYPLQPLPDSKPTYWLYHEIWRLTNIRSYEQLKKWINSILRGKDAIFSVSDPLPFLAVHHWQIPLLLLNNLQRLKGWVRIDFNIGKLVEVGGD
jgi:predicted ATP-grasp superfamily ATP-dependent carboligase